MENQTLLAITPRAYEYESLKGFILRVSEENGYQSPSAIAKILGISRNIFGSGKSPTLDLEKILGLNQESLSRHSYLAPKSQPGSGFKLLEHELGSLYGNYQIRTSPQICPICIKEDGHIDAFWDLSIANACPKHNVKSLTHCHKCSKKIEWFRPGLLTCKCGANYLEATLEQATQSNAELMGILYAKFHGQSILNIPNQSKFPIYYLENMRFSQILAMLYKFGGVSKSPELNSAEDVRGKNRHISIYARNAIKSGIRLFSDWPYGFNDFLTEYFNRLDNLGRKYKPIYQLRNLITVISTNEWFNNNARFLLNQLIIFSSKKFPLPRPATNEREGEKFPEFIVNMPAKSAFSVVKSSQYRLALTSSKDFLTPEQAAKFIGLPFDVFDLFWSSGIMGSFLSSRSQWWLKYPGSKIIIREILNIFKIRKIPKYRLSSISETNYITLDEAMKRSDINVTIKVSLIKEILNSNIHVHGQVGNNLSGLILKKQVVKKYISQCRLIDSDRCLPIHCAAAQLHTTDAVIELLIRFGLLEYRLDFEGDEKKITLESVRRFEQRFTREILMSPNNQNVFKSTLTVINQLLIQEPQTQI